MASGTVGPNGTSHDSLKQVYETALEELNGEKRPLVKAKTPIFQRRPSAKIVSPEPVSAERALEDAAKALAALWQTPKSRQQMLRPKK
jgi:hypothetical protein